MLSKREDIVPIPGTKGRKYLMDNIGAKDITLTAEETKRLESIAAHILNVRYEPQTVIKLNL